MPYGVNAIVEDGFATLEFTDNRLRATALGVLLDIGGPETIEISTGGLRRSYRVPEGNAREAGLLDG
jgi:hypothetical protein